MTLAAALLVLAVQPQAPQFTDNRIPDAALVARAEAGLVMPPGAEPLSAYDRSYTEARMDGKDLLIGQFIIHEISAGFTGNGQSPPLIRRVLMNDMVPAFDGGCAILTLIYEVDANRLVRIVCNPPGPGAH